MVCAGLGALSRRVGEAICGSPAARSLLERSAGPSALLDGRRGGPSERSAPRRAADGRATDRQSRRGDLLSGLRRPRDGRALGGQRRARSPPARASGRTDALWAVSGGRGAPPEWSARASGRSRGGSEGAICASPAARSLLERSAGASALLDGRRGGPFWLVCTAPRSGRTRYRRAEPARSPPGASARPRAGGSGHPSSSFRGCDSVPERVSALISEDRRPADQEPTKEPSSVLLGLGSVRPARPAAAFPAKRRNQPAGQAPG